VTDPSDTVHKHFKQNSGKSEFVLREGSVVAGKEVSGGEEEGDEPIYTYDHETVCPRTFHIDMGVYYIRIFIRERRARPR